MQFFSSFQSTFMRSRILVFSFFAGIRTLVVSRTQFFLGGPFSMYSFFTVFSAHHSNDWTQLEVLDPKAPKGCQKCVYRLLSLCLVSTLSQWGDWKRGRRKADRQWNRRGLSGTGFERGWDDRPLTRSLARTLVKSANGQRILFLHPRVSFFSFFRSWSVWSKNCS